MNLVLISALESLGRATAGVTASAIAIWLLLRIFPARSPTIERFAWLLVLLPGVVFWRVSVVLPVLPARQMATMEAPVEPEASQQLSAGSTSDFTTESPLGWTGALAPARSAEVATVCFIVLGTWLAGMLAAATRSVWSWVAFWRGLEPPLLVDAAWIGELNDVCEELAVPGRVSLHLTHSVGPALCFFPGGFRLLVPQAVWCRLTAGQRQAILRHELAHYLRGDLWKSLVARILAWPQWFNPLASLAVRRFEEAAEWACDDTAMAAGPECRFDYLRALLELGQADSSLPSLQAAIHGGSLQCRVRRLLSPTGKDSVMKKLVVIVAALALAAGGFARIRLVNAQSPAPEKELAKAEPATAPVVSLLTNGGFEESREDSDDPEAWFGTRIPQTAGHFILSASSRVAHSGKRSVFVAIGEGHPETKVAYNWTAVAEGWQAGETYELSGWIKVENAHHPAFIMAQCWDEEGKDGKIIGGTSTQFVFPVKGTRDWTRVSARLKVPAGTGVVRIRAGLASEGNLGAKAWFDDLSLVPVADVTVGN